MKKLFLVSSFFLVTLTFALTPRIEERKTYWEGAVSKVLEKKVTFKISPDIKSAERVDVNLEWVIKRTGEVMQQLAKDQRQKEWLKKNIDEVHFLNKKDDRKISLKQEGQKLIVFAHMESQDRVLAGPQEYDNVLIAKIPRLGQDQKQMNESNEQIAYLKKTYQEAAKIEPSITINLESVKTSPEQASKHLMALANNTIRSVSNLLGTPVNEGKLRKPSRFTFEAADIKEEVLLKLEGQHLRVSSSRKFLETGFSAPDPGNDELKKVLLVPGEKIEEY